jgi:RNA polymerase sigma factor for flagellar operon FliA
MQATEHSQKTDIGWSGATDVAERNALAAEYAPLVKFLANRIAMRLPPNVSVDDLISAGSVGLLDAIEKFDPGRAVQLRTYAECRIKGAILDELRSMDWMPRSIRKRVREMEQAAAAVEQKLRRPAKDSEIARQMGIDLDTYYRLFDAAQDLEVLSLDEYVERAQDNPGSERSHKGLIRGEDSPVDHLMARELKEVIASGIKALPRKDQIVISLYYYDGLTLREIGEVMGLTESRISQIHSKAISKLRKRLKSYFKS